jgi:hypothetical protein
MRLGTRWISTRSDPHHRNKLGLRMQKKMIRVAHGETLGYFAREPESP